jgi:two-component system chemotaxis response regulator CheB
VLTRPRAARRGYRMLVVASSTGGPEALGTLLGALPRLDVPVVVVQHMPPVFTKQFAARLDRQLPYPVREAEHGAPLEPGTVTIAAGDHHLRVVARGLGWAAIVDQGPAENYCRPAADVLFRSAAEATGGAVLAVVLTGMGQDGCRGAQAIVSRGGSVIVQDQATSVVWGMPGSVAAAGLAEQILPLRELAPVITGRLSSRGPTAVPTPAAAEGRS